MVDQIKGLVLGLQGFGLQGFGLQGFGASGFGASGFRVFRVLGFSRVQAASPSQVMPAVDHIPIRLQDVSPEC